MYDTIRDLYLHSIIMQDIIFNRGDEASKALVQAEGILKSLESAMVSKDCWFRIITFLRFTLIVVTENLKTGLMSQQLMYQYIGVLFLKIFQKWETNCPFENVDFQKSRRFAVRLPFCPFEL